MSGLMARDATGALLRDGRVGCRCCAWRLDEYEVAAGGMCARCRERGHTIPPPDPRQQTTPRDRQIRHPGRDR
ncbi:hypothetical protein [Streptomyces sp. WMMC897]|uniref:hypothetical protein n=1 Tax=Streptomyces sp. WMMC897 TaxID=3014782 RepID=UPI0022B67E66|nr:hypothetical protein [Streptomyces sp. WMMC897]MCZ7414306.1 hypothetical protein [Streptomyces sp. WMMC897]